jgi:hypothetical protein
LKRIDFLDQGQLEVQSRPERPIHDHLTQPTLPRHFGWIDDDERRPGKGD